MRIKQNDTTPPLRCALQFPSASGTVLDLTNAAGVKFIMSHVNGTPKVNRAATVLSPATAGVVMHTWLPADTNTAGVYHAEWQITWGDGTIQTLPTESYVRIEIVPDLGS